jgi:hypothetical protein
MGSIGVRLGLPLAPGATSRGTSPASQSVSGLTRLASSARATLTMPAEAAPRNHREAVGIIASMIGSIDHSDRVNPDQVPGLGQHLHAHQGVGGLVVTEYRRPSLRDIRQVFRPIVNDVDRILVICSGPAPAAARERPTLASTWRPWAARARRCVVMSDWFTSCSAYRGTWRGCCPPQHRAEEANGKDQPVVAAAACSISWLGEGSNPPSSGSQPRSSAGERGRPAVSLYRRDRLRPPLTSDSRCHADPARTSGLRSRPM